MATSGTVYSGYAMESRLYVKWTRTGTWNDSTCGSNLKWELYLDNHNWWYSNAIKCYTIYINGTAVYSGGTWSNKTSEGQILLASGTTSVTHDNDGTKDFTVSFSGWFYADDDVSGSQTFTLDTIPRASSFGTVSGVTMGSTMTININRNSNSFTHSLWYSFGSKTWQAIGSSIGTSKSFTIPLSLASEVPNATYGAMTLILRTYNGSTQVGSDVTVSYKVYVPSSVVPSISSIATAETVSGLASQFACYVRYKSKIKVTLTASGSYSSTIKSYSTTINGVTYSGSSFTTGVFNIAGSYTISTTVTDSRGRTATKTGTITIVDYYAPNATTLSVDRCLSDGTLSDEGTYAKLTYAYDIASVNSKNSKTIYLQYLNGTTWTTLTTLTAYSGSGTYVSTVTFDGNSSWEFRLYVADYFTSRTNGDMMKTVFTLINYNTSGKALAFGKVSEKSDAVEFGMDVEVDGYMRVNNNIIVKSPTVDVLRLIRTGSTNASTVGFGNDNDMLGYIGMTGNPNGGLKRWSSDLSASYTILDSNNVGSYALPISGGTLTGALTLSSGNLKVANTTNVLGEYRLNSGWIGFYRSYSDALNNTNRKGWVGISATDNLFIVSNTGYVELQNTGAYKVRLENNVFYASCGNDTVYLGANAGKWKAVYAVSGTIQTSDRNKKENIEPINDKYEELFNRLIPVSYEFNDSESDRKHLGYISQDVEDAMAEVGLTALDFAGFCKDKKQIENKTTGEMEDVLDENGEPIYEYALRYSEFIALNTHMIQKQQKEIEDLKTQVANLTALVEKLLGKDENL